MQPVHVLSDHSGQSDGFQVGQGTMSGIWFRAADAAPAQVGTGPVATLSIGRAEELVVLHRRGTYRGRPAIIRDPGVGRHTRTSEGDPAAAAEQFCGRGNGGRPCHCHARTVPCKIKMRESSIRLTHLRAVPAQLIVPVPFSRRAASAMEPVIEGYTVNDSDT